MSCIFTSAVFIMLRDHAPEKPFTQVTAPKSCMSANSVIPAYLFSFYFYSGEGMPEAERNA